MGRLHDPDTYRPEGAAPGNRSLPAGRLHDPDTYHPGIGASRWDGCTTPTLATQKVLPHGACLEEVSHESCMGVTRR